MEAVKISPKFQVAISILSISVLTEQYNTYNVQLTDVWAMRGSTAVFNCVINPYFVKDYITVVGWTHGTTSVRSG